MVVVVAPAVVVVVVVVVVVLVNGQLIFESHDTVANSPCTKRKYVKRRGSGNKIPRCIGW